MTTLSVQLILGWLGESLSRIPVAGIHHTKAMKLKDRWAFKMKKSILTKLKLMWKLGRRLMPSSRQSKRPKKKLRVKWVLKSLFLDIGTLEALHSKSGSC